LQELLISGLPNIDVDDWEKNTEYSTSFEDDAPVIKVKVNVFNLVINCIEFLHI